VISPSANFTNSRAGKIFSEATGVLRRPQRLFPLAKKVSSDKIRFTFEPRHLYSYTKAKRSSETVLDSVVRWILISQSPDGGIPAYYSLLTGYSQSYPEVTGYIIPTLYDSARVTGDNESRHAASRATQWLLSLQMSSGAFPGGLHGADTQPSIFNTGQILQGLVRAYSETNDAAILNSAKSAGDWLLSAQQSDGSWSGSYAYQNAPHTYYSMVAWSLSELAARTSNRAYALAAEQNLDWTLSHFRSDGWIDGIDLRGHPNYLHFIAYVLQGVLECASLCDRHDAIDSVAKSAWVLLRKFETSKFLPGAFDKKFSQGSGFACLTGNAQMSCVWFRLFEITGDLRYFNAALKMNEMLKQLVPQTGPQGIAGGIAGSYPIWGRYQPFRYISWGCKFFADALLLEQRMKQLFESATRRELPCAS
jgi:uncharacterized protein YyaL (SSP411 family)